MQDAVRAARSLKNRPPSIVEQTESAIRAGLLSKQMRQRVRVELQHEVQQGMHHAVGI